MTESDETNITDGRINIPNKVWDHLVDAVCAVGIMVALGLGNTDPTAVGGLVSIALGNRLSQSQ